MNRKIKFRVWDQLNKRMGDPYSIAICDTYNNIHQYYNYQYLEGDMPIGSSDSILMRHTELKDVIGKEIYEGDIVRDGDLFKLIYYAPSHFMVQIDEQDTYYSEIWGNELRVIGNIYENPELMVKLL